MTDPMMPLGRNDRPSPASRLMSRPPTNEPTRPATRAIPQSILDEDRPCNTWARAPMIIPNSRIPSSSTAVPYAILHRTTSLLAATTSSNGFKPTTPIRRSNQLSPAARVHDHSFREVDTAVLPPGSTSDPKAADVGSHVMTARNRPDTTGGTKHQIATTTPDPVDAQLEVVAVADVAVEPMVLPPGLSA